MELFAADTAASGLVRAIEDAGCFLADLLDAMPEAILITEDVRVMHVNREFTRLFGFPAGSCVGANALDMIVPDGRHYESEMLMHLVSLQGYSEMETVRRSAHGEMIEVALRVTSVRLREGTNGMFVTYRDIRKQKTEAARLQHNALHDALTGLANRALFLDCVRLTLARLRRRPDRGFAVLFLDLDGFKQVNDTLGHAAGDHLLLEVANRLRRCVRPQDAVARLGGDEFALLLDETSAAEAGHVACRIGHELSRELAIAGATVRVGASTGIAMARPEYRDAEDLLRNADMAMYQAKAAGKGRYVTWTGKVHP